VALGADQVEEHSLFVKLETSLFWLQAVGPVSLVEQLDVTV
jgi:hypothetical protein